MVPRAEQACKPVIDEGEISQDQDRPESWWVNVEADPTEDYKRVQY